MKLFYIISVLILRLVDGTECCFAPSVCKTTNPNCPEQSRSSTKFSPTRIVHGVSPTIVKTAFPLLAKKKSNDSTASKGGKIQVKLLKHIAGVGQAGDIIMVAPAFFFNKLQKTRSAVKISNDEVANNQKEKAKKNKEDVEKANSLKSKIEELNLTLSKKAGPNGHLFGGIGYRTILGELKNDFPEGHLNAKWIKIIEIKDLEGSIVDSKHGIKSIGDYVASVELLKGVSADLKLSVQAEK